LLSFCLLARSREIFFEWCQESKPRHKNKNAQNTYKKKHDIQVQFQLSQGRMTWSRWCHVAQRKNNHQHHVGARNKAKQLGSLIPKAKLRPRYE
jgi:hypothetical protein